MSEQRDIVELLNIYGGARSDGFAKLAADAAAEIAKLREQLVKAKEQLAASRVALELAAHRLHEEGAPLFMVEDARAALTDEEHKQGG